MRFNDLSIPKCSYWLERLNVLFLVEKETKSVPFISTSIISRHERANLETHSLNFLLSRIYPDDKSAFKKLISINKFNKIKVSPDFRLVNGDNATVSFKINKLDFGNGQAKEFLVATPV